jgi:peptidoglycan/xylan/chitin deacetylase (PgdA/CDA1 family)
MTGKLSCRLRRSFDKNASEGKAFLTGQMPSFVTRRKLSTPLQEVPVFVFHEVEPEPFEAQLHYLQSNGYRTLDANALEAVTRGGGREGSEVCLTFDDGTSTFWSYAFPLLKKFGFRAILFVIPGVVPEDATSYPNLEDLWEGRCVPEDLERRRHIQPLCTWHELATMHASGLVDIQSHSLTHARTHVSSRLIDFLHPGFETYFSNTGVPISSLDHPEYPERKLRLGAPVFDFAPRLAGRLRFKETPALVEAMTGYVEDHGGSTFFGRPSWRKELVALFRRWPTEKLGSFETSEEMESAIRRELAESRKILEERLANKEVRHFCYPWFASSDMADRLAVEAGYRTLHYGPALNGRKMQTIGEPFRIRRISEEYFFRLPGDGRSSLWSIWMKKAKRFMRKNTPSLAAEVEPKSS